MAKKKRQIELSCSYDRLREQKLTQAYRLLVPDTEFYNSLNTFITPEKNMEYENSSDLY
jgi:hypothetical protein